MITNYLKTATPAAVNPASMHDLFLWYDFLPAHITKDENDFILRVNSLIDGGMYLEPSFGYVDYAPLYIANDVNGYPGARFYQSGHDYNTLWPHTPVGLLKGVSYAVVMMVVNNLGGFSGIFDFHTIDDNGRMTLRAQNKLSVYARIPDSGGAIVLTSGTNPATGGNLFTVIANYADKTFYLREKGVTVASDEVCTAWTATVTTISQPQGFSLGNYNLTTIFKGSIIEFAVWQVLIILLWQVLQ